MFLTFLGVTIANAASYSLPKPTNATLDPGNNSTVFGWLTTGNGNTLIGNILDIVLLISGVLAVFYTIWSGLRYIISGGNQEKVKEARQGIINGIIGVVIIMAAFFIIRFAVSIGNTVATIK